MKKILITGGPSTGKTSLVSELKKHGFYCFDEISRELTQRMRNEGIEQIKTASGTMVQPKKNDGYFYHKSWL